MTFSAKDRRRLEGHGLSEDSARRQLELLRRPSTAVRVARPCTPGDGVRHLEDAERPDLLQAWERATAAGRATKLVPASGAASRMFQPLAPYAAAPGNTSAGRLVDAVGARVAAGDAAATAVLAFGSRLQDFAFWHEVAAPERRRLEDAQKRRAYGELLQRLLSPEGLDLARRPKGLLPFHHASESPLEVHTPLVEHLLEAAAILAGPGVPAGAGAKPVVRAHFTVGADQQSAFRRHLEEVQPVLEKLTGTRLEVSFSHQKPATDTVAADPEGEPFREEDGQILFRPGGHGALLANLQDLSREGNGDLVLIKNVDNVLPAGRRAEADLWKELLGGLLVRLQERSFELLRQLEGDSSSQLTESALDFLGSPKNLGISMEPLLAGVDDHGVRHKLACRLLDRPLRVCGMVPAAGEPGGGPFWALGEGGVLSRQIVETSEIDLEDPGQREVMAAATHFNPVDLVCGLRDHRGEPYELADFTDADRVFMAEKSYRGRPLKALEWPGLWNGAMARWNTVFVEVPAGTFAPVKTILDLLRPEHA